jgi:hypothetical protein
MKCDGEVVVSTPSVRSHARIPYDLVCDAAIYDRRNDGSPGARERLSKLGLGNQVLVSGAEVSPEPGEQVSVA